MAARHRWRHAVIVAATVLAVLPAAPARPALPGANGRIAYYTSGPSGWYEVHTVAPDGSDDRVVGGSNELSSFDPTWAPDGSKLAFARYVRDGVSEVFTADPDGTHVRQVTAGDYVARSPTWSPDGRYLAFVGGPDAHIAVVTAYGEQVDILQPECGNISWSPTADVLACSSGDGIRIVPLDRSPDRLLIPGAGHADWSPDGTRLVHVLGTMSGGGRIVVTNADGTGSVQLTDDAAHNAYPAWSPDGTSIIFTRDETPSGPSSYDSQIWTIRPDGSGLHELFHAPSWATTAQWQPVVARQPVTRLAGGDRVETAITVSSDLFGDGDAGTVVLSRADSFADALAGTPLAVRDDGPLLLTASTQLDPRVETELRRVLPVGRTVFLLGGRAALAPVIEERLRALGYTPRRIAGDNRYATAVAIADELGNPRRLLFTTGTDFPDALAAGSAAGATGGAVLLTAGSSVPPAVAAYLAAHPMGERIAVGGPAAAAIPTAERIVGADRYETAALVARRLLPPPLLTGVASGTSFADALAGGVHAALTGGALLLTRPDRLAPPAAALVDEQSAAVWEAAIYGGPSAVRDGVAAMLAPLLQ